MIGICFVNLLTAVLATNSTADNIASNVTPNPTILSTPFLAENNSTVNASQCFNNATNTTEASNAFYGGISDLSNYLKNLISNFFEAAYSHLRYVGTYFSYLGDLISKNAVSAYESVYGYINSLFEMLPVSFMGYSIVFYLISTVIIASIVGLIALEYKTKKISHLLNQLREYCNETVERIFEAKSVEYLRQSLKTNNKNLEILFSNSEASSPVLTSS